MGSDLSARPAAVARRAPMWFGPALVAVVCWVGGAHQRGPLAVFPEAQHLPLAWYVIEQAIAVAVTLAGIGAASVLLSGRVPPLRPTLAAVCDARYALALAAALASRAVVDSFLPAEPIKLGDHGLRLALSAGQYIWLAVLAAALVGLQFRAALRYLGPLRLCVPDGWRLAAAFIIMTVVGELTGWMISLNLQYFFFWPPR